jgi:hypothetical protein
MTVELIATIPTGSDKEEVLPVSNSSSMPQ